MAKDLQTKKRKASEPEAEIEKVKKVKKAVVAPEAQPKKRKATEEAAPAAVKKSKTPKSTADAPKPKTTKAKPAEKKSALVVTGKTTNVTKKANGAAGKKVKETLSTERISVSDAEADDEEDDVESEIDDQTAALLKGFESDDENEEYINNGLEEGQEVPKVPKLGRDDKKKLKAVDDDEKPGAIYVGRIPHGFYEHEMREYFMQFGTVLKLRLSRNKNTGASKHYAFILFESATVADIVARTMNNYLLLGHILKVHVVADEQLHEGIWEGANKRFKRVPWNKIQGRQLEKPAGEDKWEERRVKEEEKRAAKADKLKELGYEFEAPKIKSAKGVGKKAITSGEDEEVKAIEAAPVVEEPAKTKKKGKAAKEVESVQPVEDAPVVEKSENPKNVKTSKAAKTDDTLEVIPAVEETAKPKKEKKTKVVKEVIETEEIIEVVPTETKPKAKKTKKTVVEEVQEVVTPTEEVPEKNLKRKKSKTTLVEEPAVEKVAKVKKSKKTKEKST